MNKSGIKVLPACSTFRQFQDNRSRSSANPSLTHGQFAELSAPQLFHVIPGNFSLIVKWKPPESGTACLKHYHITTDFNKYSDNTTNTSMIIPHLHACKTYQVFINAVNKDDKEGEMIDKTSTTLPYSKQKQFRFLACFSLTCYTMVYNPMLIHQRSGMKIEFD